MLSYIDILVNGGSPSALPGSLNKHTSPCISSTISFFNSSLYISQVSPSFLYDTDSSNHFNKYQEYHKNKSDGAVAPANCLLKSDINLSTCDKNAFLCLGGVFGDEP